MGKRKAWIFDVDGTLCNVDSVLHYLKNNSNDPSFKKSFKKFHEQAINCPPNSEVVDMVWSVVNDVDIIVVTARKEQWRAQTSMWLAINNIPSDALFMRPDHDDREDYKVKKDILKKIKAFWDIEHAVDDNPRIIKLWQENNIPTTKIGNWDGK